MPRPKEFDREAALERAMELFWDRGYESASIRELVDCMGIGRASLYDTFGSKQALFAAAFRLYGDRLRARLSERLGRPGSARDALIGFFEELAAGASADGRGCLIVKSAMVVCREDEEARACARRLASMVEELLADTLQRCVREGDLPSDTPVEARARFLANTLHGLVVSGSLADDPSELRAITDGALAALWPQGVTA